MTLPISISKHPLGVLVFRHYYGQVVVEQWVFWAIFQVLWQIIWQQAGNQRARLYICSNEEQGLGFRAFNKCELQVRRYKSLTNVVVHKRWIVKLQMSTLIKANVH